MSSDLPTHVPQHQAGLAGLQLYELVRRQIHPVQGDRLPEWMEASNATAELPSRRHFAQHLLRDLDAVTAGLTLSWNSGVVDGHVNRIKMLKRQMFGRAGFRTPTQASPIGRPGSSCPTATLVTDGQVDDADS